MVAAEQGHSDTKLELGYFYSNIYKCEDKYPKALEWYRISAGNNNITAIFILGNLYFTGRGVDKNLKEAFKYFKMAFEKGHGYAAFLVGYFYSNGYGIFKDEYRGILLMVKASYEVDFTLCVIGGTFHSASTENQDFLKALEYYQRVPSGTQSSYVLKDIGILYEHGGSVDQDYDKALIFFYLCVQNESDTGTEISLKKQKKVLDHARIVHIRRGTLLF